MVPLSEDRENAAQALASDVSTVTEERRRPGRLEHITPTLIPLMRGTPQSPPVDEEPEGGNAVSGFDLVVKVRICLLVWVMVNVGLIWKLFWGAELP